MARATDKLKGKDYSSSFTLTTPLYAGVAQLAEAYSSILKQPYQCLFFSAQTSTRLLDSEMRLVVNTSKNECPGRKISMPAFLCFTLFLAAQITSQILAIHVPVPPCVGRVMMVRLVRRECPWITRGSASEMPILSTRAVPATNNSCKGRPGESEPKTCGYGKRAKERIHRGRPERH